MFKFTSHAIARYCERVAPGTSYRAATKALDDMATRATPKKMRTDSGQQQWVVDGPRCAFITKRVTDKSLKRTINLVVTVLGEDEMEKWEEPEDPYAYEKELLAEYEADLAARREKAKESKAAMEAEAEEAKQHHAARGFQYDHIGAMKEGKPKKTPKGLHSSWTHVLALIAAENKAISRYESHRETLRKSVDVTADALREALKTLTEMADCGSQNAQGCVERIKALDPGFVKPSYICNAKMEKRRIVKDS